MVNHILHTCFKPPHCPRFVVPHLSCRITLGRMALVFLIYSFSSAPMELLISMLVNPS